MAKYKYEVAKAFLRLYGWIYEGGDLWWKDRYTHDIPTDQAVERQRVINGLYTNWNYVTTVPTKKLMAWRDKCYKCHLGGRTNDYTLGYDPTNNHGPEIALCDILIELANREHIPNKQEAKDIRREKAKKKV